MFKLIGKVVLRNPYRVLMNSDGEFRVTHKNARGAEHSQDVASKVVQYVQKKFRGKTVSVADAQELLEAAPAQLGIPYDFGYQLYFYAQRVLIVLVAKRQATYGKCGRRFDYTILMRQKTGNRKHSTRGKNNDTRSRAVR
jgi:hypothetical protein